MLSVTYLSSATTPMSEDQLTGLLASFRPRNESLGLTGVLLYAGGNFIQTLEGPDEAVESTFARIALDRRHRGVFVALSEPIDERVFPDWSMGYRSLAPEQASSLPGFNDYMVAQRTLLANSEQFTRAGVFHRIFRDSWKSPGL